MTTTTEKTIDLAGQGHVLEDALDALERAVEAPIHRGYESEPWDPYLGDDRLSTEAGYMAAMLAARDSVMALTDAPPVAVALTSLTELTAFTKCAVCSAWAVIDFCAACGSKSEDHAAACVMGDFCEVCD